MADPLATNQVPIWALWIPVAATAIGSIVTGLIAYFINKTNKESEEKKHIKELAVKLAIEDHKQTWEFVLRKNKTTAIPPLDLFVLHHVIMSEATLNGKKITEEEYLSLVKKSKALETSHRNFVHPDNIA